MGSLSLSVPLSVLVADLDDNPPVFDNWEFLDFTISENRLIWPPDNFNLPAIESRIILLQ